MSACDENDEQNAEDNEEERNERMLVEVQESLERQIRELEQTEIDVDTETDETDCEVQLEEHEEVGDIGSVDDAAVFVTMSDDENASLELRYQALLSDMSWNERAEALATLQAYVARHPGRAQELHQKLSSPSRRRSLQETLKKYQAKQARAQQKRNLLQQEKAAKLQQLFARVEDVKAAQKQLIEDKRQKMEGRHQRAAENRVQYLRQIIEKAHDEEKKLKEINFIKNIEAQNKRLDLLESSKETEGRLLDLEQERQKKVEEKLAKEAAVERRRQALEKERLLKLEKMNETRLEKEQRIGKRQEQKERERQALAREKARDREERLLALQVQHKQTTEELQRKILQKQMESARRHEENIEHIRQRALELTMPTRLAEEGGRGDQEDDDAMNGNTTSTTNEDGDVSSTISDVGGISGHSRSYKKKMKKLKQRMSQWWVVLSCNLAKTPLLISSPSFQRIRVFGRHGTPTRLRETGQHSAQAAEPGGEGWRCSGTGQDSGKPLEGDSQGADLRLSGLPLHGRPGDPGQSRDQQGPGGELGDLEEVSCPEALHPYMLTTSAIPPLDLSTWPCSCTGTPVRCAPRLPATLCWATPSPPCSTPSTRASR